jgi:hypothetical protein
MNYAAFKTYLRTFLWKQNDTDLANAMDSLIRMADGELNRVLDIQRRQKTVLIAPETEDYLLPADFRHMVSVNNSATTSESGFASTTLVDIYRKRQQTNSANIMPVYAVDQGAGAQKILRLVGPFSVDNPGSLVLVYRANVPDFAALDASWLETDFLDLYTYTILSHTAPFLREDERLQVWMAMKGAAIESALVEDKHHVVHGGSPMQMQPHRRVP